MGAACCRMVDDALEDRRLRACTDKNTEKFLPELRRAKVVSVYDGDTLTIAARHARHGPPYLFKVRLEGIDAPELRGSSAAEKEAALAARDWLRQQVLGKPVTLENISLEKYGRVLATVKRRGTDLSKLALDEGHAVRYDGGKKPAFQPGHV